MGEPNPSGYLDGKELWEQLRTFVIESGGTIFIQQMGLGPAAGGTSQAPIILGHLILSVPAVGAILRQHRAEGSGWPESEAEPSEHEILRWLSHTVDARCFRLIDDLPLQIMAAKMSEEPPAPPKPQEALEEIPRHRSRRNSLARLMANWRLLAELQKPASHLLPERPRIAYAEEDCDREPSLGEYVAMAIENGDARALNVITETMRRFVRRGRKHEDWATILHEYRLTKNAIEELVKEWAEGKDESELSNQALVRRLRAAGEDLQLTAESPRFSALIARRVVGAERHVSPESIADKWKDREQLLPPLHPLLLKKNPLEE